MKKIYLGLGITIVTVGVIVASLVFINKQDAKTDSVTSEKTSLRLKWLDQAQFSGIYWAKDQGLYTAKGADVSVAPGGPDVSPIQTVANGTDGFGIIGADQLILAREKGVPVVALAVIYQDTSVAVATLKSSNITKPQDLVGKKVAVAYGKDEEVVYAAMLKNAGVDRSSIQESPLNFALSQIATNETDGQIVYENNEPVTLAQKGYEVNLIKPRDYGINFYADTLFTTEKMIKERPELVRAVTTATTEGWKQSFQNVDKAAQIIKKQNPSLDLANQKQSLSALKPLISNNGNIGQSDSKKWSEMEDILISQGVMKKRITINDVFTNNFLK
jgi:ABC-type nitrate/sulfonate/bicarbonate transport system substrate-binding protein